MSDESARLTRHGAHLLCLPEDADEIVSVVFARRLWGGVAPGRAASSPGSCVTSGVYIGFFNTHGCCRTATVVRPSVAQTSWRVRAPVLAGRGATAVTGPTQPVLTRAEASRAISTMQQALSSPRAPVREPKLGRTRQFLQLLQRPQEACDTMRSAGTPLREERAEPSVSVLLGAKHALCTR